MEFTNAQPQNSSQLLVLIVPEVQNHSLVLKKTGQWEILNAERLGRCHVLRVETWVVKVKHLNYKQRFKNKNIFSALISKKSKLNQTRKKGL